MKIDDWVWRLPMGVTEDSDEYHLVINHINRAIQITYVGEKSIDYTDYKGDECCCDKERVRLIKAGDEIRVVDEPKTLGLDGGARGAVIELFTDELGGSRIRVRNELRGPGIQIASIVGSDYSWFALMEDLRLDENREK